MKFTGPTREFCVGDPMRPIFTLFALGVCVGGNANFTFRVRSNANLTIFRYQQAGIPNANLSHWCYCPTDGSRRVFSVPVEHRLKVDKYLDKKNLPMHQFDKIQIKTTNPLVKKHSNHLNIWEQRSGTYSHKKHKLLLLEIFLNSMSKSILLLVCSIISNWYTSVFLTTTTGSVAVFFSSLL